MRVITIHNLSVQFDGDVLTTGDVKDQAQQVVEMFNTAVCRAPLNAKILANDFVDIDVEGDQFNVGDKVEWIDPDNGLASGIYTVTKVSDEFAVIEDETSEAEVPFHEIEKITGDTK